MGVLGKLFFFSVNLLCQNHNTTEKYIRFFIKSQILKYIQLLLVLLEVSQYIARNVAIVSITQLHAISTIYVSQKCSKRVTSKRFNTLHIISTFQNMLFMPANSNLHFCCYDVLYGQQWIKYLWSFLKIYVLFSFSNLWVQLSWWPWWYFYAYNSCLLFIMQR